MTRREVRPIIKQKIVVRSIPDDCNLELLSRLLTGIRYNERGCWIRGVDSSIYTTIKHGTKQRGAHRVSFELFFGVPLKHRGCHHCDTPACINPDHIFDGTDSDNIRDAVKKKRVFGIKVEGSLSLEKKREAYRNQKLFQSEHVIKNKGW